MAKYRIEIKNSAIKELNKLPKNILLKVLEKIDSLADNPRPVNSVKLTGQDRYRIRQGRYRILYSINDDILLVYVVKIAHQKSVYK